MWSKIYCKCLWLERDVDNRNEMPEGSCEFRKAVNWNFRWGPEQPQLGKQAVLQEYDIWISDYTATEDEMVGWHHRLKGHEFEQTLGDGDGQLGLVLLQFMGSQTVTI